MTWLTWRQMRVQAAAVYALVIGAAVILALTGPRLLDKARIDANIFDHLTRTERDLYYAGVVVLAIAPAVIGAFWGAPLVARELEAGTHRLVWNQSVTRSRWLATKLGLTMLVAAAAVGGLTLAITWWSGPIDGALSNTNGRLPSRLTPVAFAMRGIVPIGYAVFAVVLGVAFGVVLRRSLPAMALTLAVFTAVQIAVPLWIRPHLVPANQVTLSFSRDRLDGITGNPDGTDVTVTLATAHPNDWILSNNTIDGSGRVADLPAWAGACFAPPAPPIAGQRVAQGMDTRLNACFTRLNAEGYRQRIVYQPTSHFWPLQFAETGLFIGASGLLTWFCFWWIRRRLS
jgi:ABC-type transport system involved in multi-copper enzyme maturation permease subunit